MPRSVVTVSRLSGGTRSNVAASQNLVTWSSDITNVAWATADQPITKTGGQVDPFGSTTATRINDSTNTGTFRLFENIARTSTTTRTQSVFAKAGTKSFISLADGLGNQVWFNIVAGVVGTQMGATATITAVGTIGWYRCVMTVTAEGSNPRMIVFIAPSDGITSYTGDSTGTVFLYGPQIVEANWGGPYVATSTATIDNGAIRNSALVARAKVS